MSTAAAQSHSAIPFPAYKGTDKYMFISYAHLDSRNVFPIILKFNQQGYNVWYDEGIEPGIEWPEEIGNALSKSSLFVVFITPNSVKSENVRNEINFALSRKLPFIAIHLSETTLTPGLQLQIGSKQAILRYLMDEDSFIRKYRYSFDTVLDVGQKADATPPAPPVLTQVQEQPSTATRVSMPPATPSSVTPSTVTVPQAQQPKPAAGAIQFKCDIIRRVACAELGLPDDRQLEQKHTLAVSKLAFFADSIDANNLAIKKYKDHLMIHKRSGMPVVTYDRGSINDLSDFSHFRNLKDLSIPFQQFNDLSPLADLPLKILDLSCNTLNDLTPIGRLEQLTNLKLDYSSWQNLQPLANLHELLYLSMFGVSYPCFQELCTIDLNKLTHLILTESKLESLFGISRFQAIDFLEIQFCTIFEFDDLANLPGLKFLSMRGTKCFDYSFLKGMPNLVSLSVDEDQQPAILDLFGEKPPFLK